MSVWSVSKNAVRIEGGPVIFTALVRLAHAGVACAILFGACSPKSFGTTHKPAHHPPAAAETTSDSARIDVSMSFQAAEGMLAVIEMAQPGRVEADLALALDAVLDSEPYGVAFARYADSARPPEARASREEFRAMVLAVLTGRKHATREPRVAAAERLFRRAFADPAAYRRALAQSQDEADKVLADARRIVGQWLPPKVWISARVEVMFDPGLSFGWVYERRVIGLDLMQMVDGDRTLGGESLSGLLAHELHHLGLAVALKDYAPPEGVGADFDWIAGLLYEGAASKLCNNMPTVLSGLADSSRPTMAVDPAGGEFRQPIAVWSEYMRDSAEIFQHLRDDRARLLRGERIDAAYWDTSISEKRGQGRRYYAGAEIVGVVLAAEGRSGVTALLLHPHEWLERYKQAAAKLDVPSAYRLD